MNRAQVVLSGVLMICVGCGGQEPLGNELEEAIGVVDEAEVVSEQLGAAPAAPEAAMGPFDLRVVGSQLAQLNGASVHGVLAMMGCGYWVTARSEAHVANGAFRLDLEEALAEESYGGQLLFVYADRDGNGTCDVSGGDTIWRLEVTEEGPRVLQISHATPQADGWECMLFAEDGD